MNPDRRFSRPAKILSATAVLLASLYLVLLIPDPDPATPAIKGAGKQPFIWDQDVFWADLEARFKEARGAGCQSLAPRVATALAEAQDLLGNLSAIEHQPDDPAFAAIETRLFQLGAMVAACPDHLGDYIALVTRTRSELKKQSQRWDLDAVLPRRRLYRLLFGTRMALEEVILQTPSTVDVPQSILATDVPSRTPSTQLLGVNLHSGDILVSRGGAATSALIARGNDYPGSFSHVALLHIDEKTGRASVIESHIEKGVAVASLDEYLAEKKLRILVLRLRSDLPQLTADPMLPHKAAVASLRQARSAHIPYDFAMDYLHHDAQFCSEVVSAAYETTGVQLWKGTTTFISSRTVAAWLGSVGVKHFETQEPADLEYDSQLGVVAEWRERDTLFKAHVDDVTTDVMLERAYPGKPLPYQLSMLPVTRIVKAYSFILNLFGKIGPVPEGMRATTALRVKKFRDDHSAKVSLVMDQAEKFRGVNGYYPPFWQLNKMARDLDTPPARAH